MSIINRLKWWIAPREMAELQRWLVQWTEHRRWFGEFPQAAVVLDHMHAEVSGEPVTSIHAVRNSMRTAINDGRKSEMEQAKEAVREVASVADDAVGNAVEAKACLENGNLAGCIERLEWVEINAEEAMRKARAARSLLRAKPIRKLTIHG